MKLKNYILEIRERGLPGGPVVKNLPCKKKKRICLAMQGTPVQSLGWEDTTYHRATKPVYYTAKPAL